MAILSAHFYSRNEGIAYPVDEFATVRDDAGTVLPANILVDMALRWPKLYGEFAFLASVTVSSGAVTLTIQAATSASVSTGFAPLAVLTVPRPIVLGRQYPLSPQAAGVGGWVAFGSGVNDGSYAGRFSSPAQSVLCGRVARSYRDLPVQSMQAAGAATALTGLIRLRALAPLEIAVEEHEIETVLRDCIVFRLVDAAGATTSVFEAFAGPCSGRLESHSCGDPQPIEFLNGVGPDCAGVITLALGGCADVIPGDEAGLVALTCNLQLADACADKRLDVDYGVPAVFTPGPDLAAVSASGPIEGGDCMVSFDAGSPSGVFGEVGLWEIVSNPDTETSIGGVVSYLFAANTAASRNVAYTSCSGTGCRDRRVTVTFQIARGPNGARHNGSALLAYQKAIGSDTQGTYYAAVCNYDTQTLDVVFFNGSSFVPLASIPAPGIKLEKFYAVSLLAGDGEFGPNTLTATLDSLEDAAVAATVTAPSVATYPPLYGAFGIGSDRSVTQFRFVNVLGV